MKAIQMILACLGRVCVGVFFVLSGLNHMLDWNGSLQTVQNGICNLLDRSASMPLVSALGEMALPMVSTLTAVAIGLLLLGGLLVFFGVKTRFGAFLLILFIVPTTFLFHAFWMLPADQNAVQMSHFMKNLAIFGGLLVLLAFGNGSYGKKAAPKAPREE